MIVLLGGLWAPTVWAQSPAPDPGTRVVLDRDNDGVRLLLDASPEDEDPDEGVSIGIGHDM